MNEKKNSYEVMNYRKRKIFSKGINNGKDKSDCEKKVGKNREN